METVFLHRFYQNNPEGDEWGGNKKQEIFQKYGGICWSHDKIKLNTTVSFYEKSSLSLPVYKECLADMKVFHRGVAIAPNMHWNEQHVFSGSVARKPFENYLEIYYTRIHFDHHHFSDNSLQAKAIALDEGGENWSAAQNPVLQTPAIKGIFKKDGKSVAFYECRDPYVFSLNAQRFMLLGGYVGPENLSQKGLHKPVGRHQANTYGAIAFAKEIEGNWEAGEILYTSEKEGSNIECPNFLKTKNLGVLVFSFQEKDEGVEDLLGEKTQSVKYLIGEMILKKDALLFIPQKNNEKPLDLYEGNSAYATTLSHNPFDNRILALSWVRETKKASSHKKTSKGNGWQGYSLLHEIGFSKGGHLIQKPLWEMSSKKNTHTIRQNSPFSVKEEKTSKDISILFYNKEKKRESKQENRIEITYRKAYKNIPEGKCYITIKDDKIFFENPSSIKKSFRKFSSPYYGKKTRKELRIIIDKCSLEIYACGGLYHFVATIAPALNDIPKKLQGLEISISSNKKTLVQYTSQTLLENFYD